MTKKILLFLILICSTSLGITAERYTGIRTNLDNTWNILQPYSTAAYTIYLTSANPSGTTTGRYTMYATSFTLEQLNSGGKATTNYFDAILSTSNQLQRIIDNVTTNASNFTFTLAQGCYENLLATGTAGIRVDAEGQTDGLQYDVDGKSVSFSTGTANAITIYLNATRYLSHRKTAEAGKTFVVGKIASNLTFGGTGTIAGTIYEGNVATNCVTQLNVPLPGTTTANYYEENFYMPFPLMSATGSGKAQKYEVLCSTYITGGYIGIIGETR